jgi:hypothetical protein
MARSSTRSLCPTPTTFLSEVGLSEVGGIDNSNQFFVFGFTDADLKAFGDYSFIPQDVAAIPEPSTWAMGIAGFGGLGLLAHCGKRKAPRIA